MRFNRIIFELFIPVFFIFDLNISFCFDYVRLIFFSVVCFISFVVFFYSKYYMDILFEEDFDQFRFIMVFFLFVVSMFFLVFSFS